MTSSPKPSLTAVRIVEAAAQLFAQHGFKGTTTRDIAQLADLNEATLFRYFPHKPELFWAAIESHLARVKLAGETQTSLAGNEAPAIVVPRLVAFVLDNLNQQPQLRRLLHVAAFELPAADAEKMIREHLGPIFDMVSAYFARCCDQGTLRAVTPALATLGLLGLVVAHQNWRAWLIETPSPEDNTPEAYATLWLNALTPPAEAGCR